MNGILRFNNVARLVVFKTAHRAPFFDLFPPFGQSVFFNRRFAFFHLIHQHFKGNASITYNAYLNEDGTMSVTVEAGDGVWWNYLLTR